MVTPTDQVVCIVMQPAILQLKKSALIFVVTLHLIDPKAQQTELSRTKTSADKHRYNQAKGLDLDYIV